MKLLLRDSVRYFDLFVVSKCTHAGLTEYLQINYFRVLHVSTTQKPKEIN
jgi:hypothetical protein